MPRGQYPRKAVAETAETTQESCSMLDIRLELVRIAHAHGRKAEDTIDLCKKLEAYLCGKPAEKSENQRTS